MGKKTVVREEPRKATLVMSVDEFKGMLEQRISAGRELFKIQVTRNTTPYGMMGYGAYNRGYVSQEERQYNKEEIEAFKKEYYKWTDFNAELLKQAFDYPDNEYQREYENVGEILLLGDEDVMEDYHNKINTKIAALERLIEKLPLLPKIKPTTTSTVTEVKKSSNKVFIVHGHDKAIRTEVELLVKNLGFEPIVLFKKTSGSDTIIEKLFREASDVSFAIALYTKCDEGKAVEETDLKPRARQNVVFEHGLMCGMLGRKKVVALVEEGVEIPGDLSGVVYISLNDTNWQFNVAREMKSSGLEVDLNKLA